MVSNVPGVQSQAFMCGEPIESMHFVTCLPIGLYARILTYNGMISLSLCGDAFYERDLSLFAAKWDQELAAFSAEMLSVTSIQTNWKKILVRRILFFVFVNLLIGGATYALYKFVYD